MRFLSSWDPESGAEGHQELPGQTHPQDIIGACLTLKHGPWERQMAHKETERPICASDAVGLRVTACLTRYGCVDPAYVGWNFGIAPAAIRQRLVLPGKMYTV